MAHRGKAVHDAIMRSPTDANMENTEDTMLIETNQTKTTQETQKKAVLANVRRTPLLENRDRNNNNSTDICCFK